MYRTRIGIGVMQTMKNWCGDNLALDPVRHRQSWFIYLGRNLLFNALMRSMLIVIGQVSLHQTMQLFLAYNQEKIQALPPERTDESFAERISPGRQNGRLEYLDATASGDFGKELAKFLVIVTDEKSGSIAPGGGFSQLLGNPGIRRVTGDSEMHDLSRLVGDDDKDVEGTKEQVMNHREVTSPHLVSMILEEGGPTLSRGPFAHLVDALLNGRFPQFDAQFEELSLDVFCTPGVVFSGHLVNEIDSRLGCCLRMFFGFDFRFQYQRKRSRCHLVLVSLARKVNRTRSPAVSLGRLTDRLRTMSCCLSMAFSARRSARLRGRSDNVPTARVAVVGLVSFLIFSLIWLTKFLQALRMVNNMI